MSNARLFSPVKEGQKPQNDEKTNNNKQLSWEMQSLIIKEKSPRWDLFKVFREEIKEPKSILVFDIDETLWDSAKREFIEKEAIQRIIKKARAHNCLVTVATSRWLYQANEDDVKTIIRALGEDNFSWICFTNARSKRGFLKYLRTSYYNHLPKKAGAAKICLIDDLERNLSECKKFFTILVDKNKEYLNKIESFIDSISLEKTLLDQPSNQVASSVVASTEVNTIKSTPCSMTK